MTVKSPQSVVVTGAANGIGKACTEYLLAKGHQILALDLELAALQGAFQEERQNLKFCAADISQTEDCQNAITRACEHFGKIDALIHWAGVHQMKRWDELTKEDFDRTLAINVTGAFLMAQAAAKSMRDTGGGSIVMTGSTGVMVGATGDMHGSGGPAYTASKSAITGLTRSLAKALGPHKIRVNSVVPGPTITPMTQDYTEETTSLLTDMIPLGHIASATEIAEVGCFLITEESRYITGETIVANGGLAFG